MHDRARSEQPHVVVVGGGFGGLAVARRLGNAPVRVTLVDRENHHLFQPLLYQVAMAELSAQDIAVPTRSVLRAQDNTTVLMAEVTSVDTVHRRLELDAGELSYDYLVLAAGSDTNYFGHDAWRPLAPSLKCVDDAMEVRRRVLTAFELAEREGDAARRRQLLDFVVIGGGPTGVELAGALAELARTVLTDDFRAIDPGAARITLVEAGPRILATFDESLSLRAEEQLRELGVVVLTGIRVVGVDAQGVELAEGRKIQASTVIWTAGVRPSPLAASLGAPLDRTGRVIVEPDLSIAAHPEVFVIGDMACFVQDGTPLPGVSPVAMQEGRAVARAIERSIRGRPREAFVYRDKGSMATIGRSRAIAQIGRVRMSGFIAWLAWLVVHIWYLVDFRNRVVVMLNWAWSYFTFRRGARVIVGTHELPPPTLPLFARVTPSPREEVRADGAPRAQPNGGPQPSAA
jgi:NADH dehydrogenase